MSVNVYFWGQWVQFFKLNRYTADKKSSLHGWRGAWPLFRSAQIFSVINIFKTYKYLGFTEYLLLNIKFNFSGVEFFFAFYYVLLSMKGKILEAPKRHIWVYRLRFFKYLVYEQYRQFVIFVPLTTGKGLFGNN